MRGVGDATWAPARYKGAITIMGTPFPGIAIICGARSKRSPRAHKSLVSHLLKTSHFDRHYFWIGFPRF